MEVFIVVFIILKICKWLFSTSNDTTTTTQSKTYSDPIDKAFDHWDNNPEELDMEDMFWLDELIGDD